MRDEMNELGIYSFCRVMRVFVWKFYTELFASSCEYLAYIFEESYSTVVTSSAKNQVSTN